MAKILSSSWWSGQEELRNRKHVSELPCLANISCFGFWVDYGYWVTSSSPVQTKYLDYVFVCHCPHLVSLSETALSVMALAYGNVLPHSKLSVT